MKMIPVNYAEIRQSYKRTKMQSLLVEFEKMDVPCVLLEDGNWTRVYNGVSSINSAARRFKKLHIQAFARNGKIYLMNTIKVECLENGQ